MKTIKILLEGCKSACINPILDDDSLFKGLVVDKKMVAFIGNGFVKRKRTTQPNGKQVCNFAFSEYNFHAGCKLSKEEV